MKFGSDMWLWLKLLVGLIKLLKEIFGDDEDRQDIKKNGDTLHI